MNGNTERTSLVTALIILLGASAGPAQDLELSGFADVLFMPADGGSEEPPFSLGQAEVDLASAVSSWIDVEMAVAWDGEAFGLGALVADLRLLGDPASHRKGWDAVDHAGLLVGQMDVPFGLDWMFYPSVERRFVTGPDVVAGTHDGWNDVGCAFYAENSRFNAVAYALNGTGYEAAVDTVGGDVGSAYGGRLGLALTDGLELGTSYATLLTPDETTTSTLWGLDLQLQAGPFAFRGERIEQLLGEDLDSRAWRRGWYAQGQYTTGSWFALTRWCRLEELAEDEPLTSRICFGLGHALAERCELRWEQQFDVDRSADRSTLQLVCSF